MEVPVVGGCRDLVAGLRGRQPTIDALRQLHDVVVGAPRRRQLGGQRLDDRAQLLDLAHFLDVDAADVGALAGDHLHEAGGLEGADRLAHRVAGHAELFGDVALDQPFAGRERSVEDHRPDALRDDVTEGPVVEHVCCDRRPRVLRSDVGRRPYVPRPLPGRGGYCPRPAVCNIQYCATSTPRGCTRATREAR